MNLERTGALWLLGLTAAVALLVFGLPIARGRAAASPITGSPAPVEARACMTVVAEHAACALPPRGADRAAPSGASSVVR
jgi:hypothetical protein